MRILALETSDWSGSVALLDEESVAAQCQLGRRDRTAKALAPAIQQLLVDLSWKPTEIDLVAVTQGPGSFTGLRVGVTTAKTFGFAVGADVLGVDTLDVIAAALPLSGAPVWIVMDAQRQQLFARRFEFSTEKQSWFGSNATCIVDNQEWLQSLTPADRVAGPGLIGLRDQIPGTVAVLDEPFWYPHASFVGQIARREYYRRAKTDVFTLAPWYFRDSAAEEKARSVADGKQ